MSLEAHAAFVVATAALAILPGPNVALITANAVAYGRRFGLITVLGTSAAMAPQLALTALGMTGVLTLAGEMIEWIRWAGVAYLAYLGVQAWRAPVVDLSRVQPQPRSARAIFLRGFLVSSSNHKTLLFYGAFFPQFLTPDGDMMLQLGVLSLSFLIIVSALDCCWALLADRLRALLTTRRRLRNRLTAAFYFFAATGLASVKRAA